MDQPTIYITSKDKEKLWELIQREKFAEYRGSPYIKMLSTEIEKAQVVEPKQIPPDVITLNSTVELVDKATNDEMVYTLVFPEDANVSEGKISVLAPIGTAMLGYKEGDTFEWDTPGGKRSIFVKKIVFQPEAAGDYR